MKDTFYFSHDYNARTDEKIKKLIKKHGMAGYGIFWSIVEDLYNNANALRTDYDDIAYDLRSEDEVIKSIINDFDLFRIEDNFFGSVSIERRLDERSEKSEKARQKAFKRWRKDVNGDHTVLASDATALKKDATVTKIDAVKDRKGKYIKGDDIKGYKIKNSRINRESIFSDPNQEPEIQIHNELGLNQNADTFLGVLRTEEVNRARAKSSNLLIEPEALNYVDMTGGEEPSNIMQSKMLDEPELNKLSEVDAEDNDW
jgi:hypothetical protein